MDAAARLTSKGQVTIPKAVRDALEQHEGDEIVFRVEHSRATVAKTPDFIGMAGTVTVPEAKRGTPWGEVLRQTRRARGGVPLRAFLDTNVLVRHRPSSASSPSCDPVAAA